MLNDLDNALLYGKKCFEIAENLDNKEFELYTLSTIADAFYHKGELDKALGFYEKALDLKINEKIKSRIYSDIALIYSKEGNFEEAINYSQKAIEIDKKYSNYRGLVIDLLNLGEIYRQAGNFSEAEFFLLAGLNEAKELNNEFWEATAYFDLDKFYMNKYEKSSNFSDIIYAKEYLTKAHYLYESTDDKAKVMELLERVNAIINSEFELKKSE